MYNSKRNKHLVNQIDIAGIIWNHMIALQRRYYRLTGKYIWEFRMSHHLLKLRKTQRFSYWKKVGSQAVQQLAERHHRAYQRFFNYKAGKTQLKCGRPGFKKVKKYKSFTLKQSGWKLLGDNKIKIQGHNYKFCLSRPVEGDIKTVTIKRDNVGRLWVYFSVIQDVTDPVVVSTGKIGGFDFGLKQYLTDSNGNVYSSPQLFKSEMHNIAKLNRSLSKKKIGSNNCEKARKRLSMAHIKIANKRKDFHWKLAYTLAEEFDYLFFEDLNIAGMKKLWGRKVSDLSFSSFLDIQKQVCQKTGKTFVKIGRWKPTTKPCSRCGVIHELSLSDRTFRCTDCGFVIDRDYNAAINICVEGASSTGLGDVRHLFLDAFAVRPQESYPL